MSPLERLFLLEIDYHARLRAYGRTAAEADGIRASYALQCGYEDLIRSAGHVAACDVDALCGRLRQQADVRDVLAARQTVTQLLGLSP